MFKGVQGVTVHEADQKRFRRCPEPAEPVQKRFSRFRECSGAVHGVFRSGSGGVRVRFGAGSAGSAAPLGGALSMRSLCGTAP